MSYEQHIAEDRRLVILRSLLEADGYDQNSSIIQTVLEMYGHQPSRDLLHNELNWLAEQGLITTRKIHSVVVAKLTPRGSDAATGRIKIDGVKRPGPGVA